MSPTAALKGNLFRKRKVPRNLGMSVNRKTLLTGVILIGIFGASVLVRLPQLRGPIRYRHEVCLTAIVLRHIEIWDKGGIIKYHFAPIMTYPGNANRHISNQESLRLQMDDRGNFYYTSYPPLSLYVVYAIIRVLHIHPDAVFLRGLNLLWEFICAVLIYLILNFSG